jgi:hypothetical protein
MRGTIHCGARADQDLAAIATGFENAEQSAIWLCGQFARYTPGKVYCVAEAPSGGLVNMPFGLFCTPLYEGSGYRVLYSTFEGAEGVC